MLLVVVLGKYVNSLRMWWLLFSLFTSKMLVFVCVKYSDHTQYSEPDLVITKGFKVSIFIGRLYIT